MTPSGEGDLVARFSSAAFMVGGLLSVASAFQPGEARPGGDRITIIAGAFAMGVGAIQRRVGRGPRELFDLVFALTGIWLIVVATRVTMPAKAAVWSLPLLLLPTVLTAAFFSTRRMALILACSVAGAVVLLQPAVTQDDARLGLPLQAIAFFAFTAVISAVAIRYHADRRREVVAQLEALAATDVLTGLANRRQFVRAAEEILASTAIERAPTTLVLADLDHFKDVNDTYGHDVGDMVLVETARAMRESCRPDDVVARLGGEEFALILAGATVEAANTITTCLAQRLRGLQPVPVTASFGVIETGPGAGDLRMLLRCADRALYEAKASGRDRAVVATLGPSLS